MLHWSVRLNGSPINGLVVRWRSLTSFAALCASKLAFTITKSFLSSVLRLFKEFGSSRERFSACPQILRTLKITLGQKKASSYLLSRDEPSIIGVRELDFRVRNGNGYYLSTMATGIINNAKYEVRKTINRARRTDN